ncbi:hypothetical protein BCF44_101205 [Kutzneria buriramensis]|uniref:Uncharacterized protein n=2 Tax=Kutzneria buriramensis TaxID=1045776 RepID=A0A3E0I8T8_9PSEU|nr:hypothetical protein BCF44_101205 [Kutzneria buriramensis]
MEDAAAQALLDEVVADWTAGTVLSVLRELVPAVWRRNLDRHEPRLGDDPTTLGIQSSRNICNLAVQELAGVPGVQARDARTLEVTYQGRMLHAGKVASRSRNWNVWSADWSDSDVRSNCAEANSKAYVSLAGTLFAAAEPFGGQPADPRVLRHLLLMWQGFDDGSTRTWLGFPRLDTEPWFAVVLLDDDPGGRGGMPTTSGSPTPPAPDFDTLGEPSLELARRVEREQRHKPQGA